MPETVQPGVGVTIDTATVPLRIEALTHQIFRLAIGHRPFGAPSSYLPEMSPPPRLSAARTHDHGLVSELGNGWMLQVDALRFPSPGYCPEGHFPDLTTKLIDEECNRPRSQPWLGEANR